MGESWERQGRAHALTRATIMHHSHQRELQRNTYSYNFNKMHRQTLVPISQDKRFPTFNGSELHQLTTLPTSKKNSTYSLIKPIVKNTSFYTYLQITSQKHASTSISCQDRTHAQAHACTRARSRPTSADASAISHAVGDGITNTDTDKHTFSYTDDAYTAVHQSHVIKRLKSREVSFVIQ